MKKRNTTVIQKSRKKMGRPPTVHGEHLVAMRLSTEMLAEIDRWAKDNKSSRSDAIRELIEHGLRSR